MNVTINEWMYLSNDKEVILEFAAIAGLPDWAPPRLVEQLGCCHRLVDEPLRNKTKWLLETLCKAQDMELAWRLLRKSFGSIVANECEDRKCQKWTGFVMDLYGEIERATEIRPLSTLDDRKARINAQNKTVKTLIQMAEKLKGLDIKISLPMFLKNSGILRGSVMSEPKSIIQIQQGFCADEPFSSMFDILEKTNCAAIPITEVEDGIEKLFRYFPCGEVLLDFLLDALAAHIEKLELYEPQNKPGHQHRFFILSIGGFFKERLGSPHYNIITAIVNAFYPGADLNKERVVSIFGAA